MLKTTQSPGPIPPDDDERPIGDLVQELVEDGKAYARAELDLAKAMAMAKANALKLPAILLFGALLFVQAAITMLAFGLFAAFLGGLGPIGAALVSFAIFAAIAGALAWYAVNRLREDL